MTPSTLESRLREHFAAKAELIAIEPAAAPAQPPPALPRPWRLTAVVAAAAALVLLAVGVVAWTVRSLRAADPVAPPPDELTPTLQPGVLDWTPAGTIDARGAFAIFERDGTVYLFAEPEEALAPGAPPLRVWSGPVAGPLTELPIDPADFGAAPVVSALAFDGDRFHAFGVEALGDPAFPIPAATKTWTSTDGVAWDEAVLTLPPDPEGRPYVYLGGNPEEAAASARGVAVVLSLRPLFDWDALLADRLGDAYQPGTETTRVFDGTSYRVRDRDGNLLLEVTAAEIGFDEDEELGKSEALVLSSPGDGDYRPVLQPSGDPVRQPISVLASDEQLLLLALVGDEFDTVAWTSRDGRTWTSAPSDLGERPFGDPGGSFRGQFLAGENGEGAGDVLLGSGDGLRWSPLSPPLTGPGPGQTVVGRWFASDAGLIVTGSQVTPAAAPLRPIERGGVQVSAEPGSGMVVVEPAGGGEPVVSVLVWATTSGGLPEGVTESGDGTIELRAESGDVVAELAPAEWQQLVASARSSTIRPLAWFSPDGQTWTLEQLEEPFTSPFFTRGALVTDDGVVLVVNRAIGGEDQAPPAAGAEIWVGRVAR